MTNFKIIDSGIIHDTRLKIGQMTEKNVKKKWSREKGHY